MNYYEYEIGDLIKRELSRMYGIGDFDVLYRYLLLRYECDSIDKVEKSIDEFVKKNNLIKFMLKELGIAVENEVVNYNGEPISTKPIIGYCFSNIIEDWSFSSTLNPVITQEGLFKDVDVYLHEVKKGLVKKSKKICKKYKKENDYWYRVKYEYLMLLNELFHTQVLQSNKIDGFEYSNDNVEFETLEVVYRKRFISDTEYSYNIELITESLLEEYMKHNLHLIERGLKLVATQYILPKGRIDILAKDSKGVYVVIELKVEEDTDIVWQSLYYRSEIKKIKNVNEVRFITIMPQCGDHIFDSLQLVGGVEIFEYIPLIKNEQLIKVQLKRKLTHKKIVNKVA